jgi:hypothetical protein
LQALRLLVAYGAKASKPKPAGPCSCVEIPADLAQDSELKAIG